MHTLNVIELLEGGMHMSREAESKNRNKPKELACKGDPEHRREAWAQSQI